MRPPLLGVGLVVVFFACVVLLPGVHSYNSTSRQHGIANTPPRGWNSYDAFGWVVSEEEFLANAEILSKNFLKHGYEYVIVDYLWYRRHVNGSYRDSYGYDVLDPWGRVIPDPDRWPSSRGGNGFKEVAKKVHDMGLKFGIHVMRGISTQAVNTDCPILDVVKGGVYEEQGRQWRARNIGVKEMPCAWMKHGFMSVNTDEGAGRAFLRSLYTQYAEWGVDFVKLDCIFGDDLDIKEIMTVSELLENLDHPIVFSISPGTNVTTEMAQRVSDHVNMYRITGDDWDTWPDVSAHFNVTRDLAASRLIGAKGLHGKSWPDLDMLPFGRLTDSSGNEGPYRKCNLTLDEQRTQITLWSMAKSPLMFGGDLRNIDDSTYNLITKPALLDINSFSTNNMEFPYIIAGLNHQKQNILMQTTRSARNSNWQNKNNAIFTPCNDPMARGWFFRRTDSALCWKDESSCQYKRYKSDSLTYEKVRVLYQGQLQSLVTQGANNCLDASPKRKLSASETKAISFSPCEREASQVWEINNDGTLKSNYSGFCIKLNVEKDYMNVGEARAWVASGKRGEVYLAFFNLSSVTMTISARVADLAKFLPVGTLGKGTCRSTEVWSERDFGTSSTLSMPVSSHACALFILYCN